MVLIIILLFLNIGITIQNLPDKIYGAADSWLQEKTGTSLANIQEKSAYAAKLASNIDVTAREGVGQGQGIWQAAAH